MIRLGENAIDYVFLTAFLQNSQIVAESYNCFEFLFTRTMGEHGSKTFDYNFFTEALLLGMFIVEKRQAD